MFLFECYFILFTCFEGICCWIGFLFAFLRKNLNWVDRDGERVWKDRGGEDYDQNIFKLKKYFE